MSTQYQHSRDVPTNVLADRLDELSSAVTKGQAGMHEFYMRIPAELDHDADLVLAEAARRLRQLQVVTVDNHDGTYTHSVSIPIGDNGWLTEADKAADDQLNFGIKIDAHN